ncbi:DUF4173 domain-containing protein, partial [Amycolatopsis rhizosphaerae]|uniref:DUF4153 domain-containing protein n=1 Tax=Amycolatopsis rhizosphaerae TaxID=2053003 RepID=UPI001643D946
RGRAGGVPARLFLSVVAGLVLVALFGALFADADPTFAGLLSQAVPTVDGPSVFGWLFLFAVAGTGTAAAAHLLLAPPPAPPVAKKKPRLRLLEWAVPLALLVLLFAAFVVNQLTVLFGGADAVLRTADLTYAQYARSGFWQLLMVTALTLLVIAVVVVEADRTVRACRLWMRVLLGSLSVLTLVIVASALTRMWSYQRAYGFTVLRLGVETAELWLGVVYRW